jgi:hypothetical protein
MKLHSPFAFSPSRILFIVVFLFFVCMQYLISAGPHGVSAIAAAAPGVSIPDMQVNYSPGQAHRTFVNLGEEGRKAYRRMLAVDFVFIPAYTLFFMVSLSMLGRFFFGGKPMIRLVPILPLLSGLFDAAENCCSLMQLSAFPRELPVAALLSNYSTLAKFGTVGICEVALVIGFIAWLVTMIRRRTHR